MIDHYTVEVFWSDEDKGFIAFVHELEGCSAWGETRDAALREVEAAKEMGRQIPIPNHRYTHLRAEDLVERMK